MSSIDSRAASLSSSPITCSFSSSCTFLRRRVALRAVPARLLSASGSPPSCMGYIPVRESSPSYYAKVILSSLA